MVSIFTYPFGVELFKEHHFGKAPGREEFSFKVFDSGTPALGGQAIRKQITLYFTRDTTAHKDEKRGWYH